MVGFEYLVARIFETLAGRLEAFAGFGILLALLEILRPASKVTSRGRLRGATFNLFFILAGATALTSVERLGIKPLLDFKSPVAPVVTVAYILFADFLGYWQHRAMHAVPWLWRIHRTHHSITEMSAFCSYKHWAEELVTAILIYLPLAFIVHIGTSVWGWLLAVPLANTIYAHSASRSGLGPLAAVWMDNRLHRLHHSPAPEHVDRNFGAILTLWDWLFGTLVWPKPGEWPLVGATGWREPATVGRYLVDPLS